MQRVLLKNKALIGFDSPPNTREPVEELRA